MDDRCCTLMPLTFLTLVTGLNLPSVRLQIFAPKTQDSERMAQRLTSEYDEYFVLRFVGSLIAQTLSDEFRDRDI